MNTKNRRNSNTQVKSYSTYSIFFSLVSKSQLLVEGKRGERKNINERDAECKRIYVK